MAKKKNDPWDNYISNLDGQSNNNPNNELLGDNSDPWDSYITKLDQKPEPKLPTASPKKTNTGILDGVGAFLKNINTRVGEAVGAVGNSTENPIGSNTDYQNKKNLLSQAEKDLVAINAEKQGKLPLSDKIYNYLFRDPSGYANPKSIEGLKQDIAAYEKNLPQQQAKQAAIDKQLPGIAKTASNVAGDTLGFLGKMTLANQTMGVGGLTSMASKAPGALSTSEVIAENSAGQALRNLLASKAASRIAEQSALGAGFEGASATMEGDNNIAKRMALGAVEFPVFGEAGQAVKGLVKGVNPSEIGKYLETGTANINPSAAREYTGRLAGGGVQGLGFTEADSLANKGKLAPANELLSNSAGMGLLNLVSGGKYNPALEKPSLPVINIPDSGLTKESLTMPPENVSYSPSAGQNLSDAITKIKEDQAINNTVTVSQNFNPNYIADKNLLNPLFSQYEKEIGIKLGPTIREDIIKQTPGNLLEKNLAESKLSPLEPPQNAPVTPENIGAGINTPGQLPNANVAESIGNSATIKEGQLPGMGGFNTRAIDLNNLPDTKGQIASKLENPKLGLGNIKDTAYTKSIDNLFPLKQFDTYTESVKGGKISPEDSIYKLGLNSRGSDVIANHIALERMVSPTGETVGGSLADITKQIPKGLDKDFEDYLIHKHAPSWMEQGRKVFPEGMGVTSEVSAAKVAQYEKAHPEFKKLAEQFYNFRDNLIKEWLVKPGIISEETYKVLKDKYPNYIPLRREQGELSQPLFKGPKKGFANQTNPLKKATGSEKPIISPIESTIEDISNYVKISKRNEVMQKVINNVKQNPDAFKGFAEIVKEPRQNLVDDINKTLQEEGIDGLVNKYNQQYEEVFKQKQKLSDGNIVTGIVNGQKVHVKIDDAQFLEALTKLSPQAQGVLINSVGRITNVMKNLTTGINPVFSLARNIFRDIPTAYTFSKTTNNPLRFGVDLLHSFGSVLAESAPQTVKNNVKWIDSLSTLYKDYKAVGGGHASSIAADRNLLAQTKSKLLPLEQSPISKAKALGQKGLGLIESFNNAIESGPRLGEFKRATKAGSKVEGLYQANDVTVNFKKYGDYSKEVDAVVPYFNAALQGLDKLGRVFAENPVQAGAKAFLSISVPTILLYSINHNNPNYQKLNDYTKDGNFLIPNKDGTFTKIPKPRELGVMFGSSVERVLRSWQDNDPKAFDNFMETVKTNFIPPTRTIFAPLNDIRSNKDFVGRPIVSKSMEKLSPKLQYDEKTSEPSKAIGNLLNVSPKKIDYLAKSYLGLIGQLGIPATSKGSTVGETLKRQVTVDPLYSNDIINNFYEHKTQLDTEYNDFRQTGQKESEQHKTERNKYARLADLFSKYRKEINKTEKDRSLSDLIREQKLRALQEAMQQRALKLK